MNRFVLFLACLVMLIAHAAKGATEEGRATVVKTLDTKWSFPEVKSQAEWEQRAKEIREHVLVSCGLWPMPEKTPLNAKVFGRLERDGYIVEKVYFQTMPGFYLAGNLYRPLGKGSGPFPGVLNPHGHWRNGRLEDQELGSIAARCINMARQGMVAFSYDMVGYNDTIQVPHTFASDPTNQLWSISLMGLQTWNSIRALDFLASLSDVDTNRLACTGESGGGTQTFMLGAIDSRLAVQAPIVMVSHSMQGGCLCENAPGLRIDFSNMEIAAAAAPRPQLLVAATGDWTRATMEVEGPSIESIYRLFNKPENFSYVVYDYDHNYNRTSREAVYRWFGKWLLGRDGEVAEAAYVKEPDEALRVWPDKKLPEGALSETQLIEALISGAKAALARLTPTDAASFERFKKTMMPAWQHTLAITSTLRRHTTSGVLYSHRVVAATNSVSKKTGFATAEVILSSQGRSNEVPVTFVSPNRRPTEWLVVLVGPDDGKEFLYSPNEKVPTARPPKGLGKYLLDEGHTLAVVELFRPAGTNRNQVKRYFTTYNRTDMQERVHDIVTACKYAKQTAHFRNVLVVGVGDEGATALLAAPAADAVIADADSVTADGINARHETEHLMRTENFVPGIQCIGGFAGAAALAAPRPLLVYNGKRVNDQLLTAAYESTGARESLKLVNGSMDDDALLKWISSVASSQRASRQ